jgi:hypothetical protein
VNGFARRLLAPIRRSWRHVGSAPVLHAGPEPRFRRRQGWRRGQGIGWRCEAIRPRTTKVNGEARGLGRESGRVGLEVEYELDARAGHGWHRRAVEVGDTAWWTCRLMIRWTWGGGRGLPERAVRATAGGRTGVAGA